MKTQNDSQKSPIGSGCCLLLCNFDPFVFFCSTEFGGAAAQLIESFRRERMPFPLAHPAAVLPLRRFCPRYLNFSALIIGSFCPDLGYFSGPFHLDNFSHRITGSFGFCLPVGLVILIVFYLVRSRVIGILPLVYRHVFSPICQPPVGTVFSAVASIMIGTWTHLLLDSITHQDGWLAKQLFAGQSFSQGFQSISDALYAVCTFFGVLWLALCYQRSNDNLMPSVMSAGVGRKWICALSLAGSILFVARASRGSRQSLGIVPAGFVAVLLVLAFFVATGIRSGKCGAQR